MTPAGRVLIAGRALRTFAFGALSLVLALYLYARGFAPAAIGAVFTATLVEDALLTALVGAHAQRIGRRRVLVGSALLLSLAGVVLALAERPWLILAGAVLGTLSPSGQEAGPCSPIEQALLPDAAPAVRRTRLFAWYSVFGFLPSALGAFAAGGWLALAGRVGLQSGTAYRAIFVFYALAGLALALLYLRLPAGDAPAPGAPRASRFGLHRSRGVVLELAGLQALDSLAGGFVIQSLLAYWFHLRFGAGPEALGALFFGTNLLSAVSFLVAARVAERVGLLNTMVFSHLPSNVLLLLVPLAGSLPAAAALLLARHLLSQMDVPTRQAYTMALVAPDERAAAAGWTTAARAAAQAIAPLFSGIALGGAASGLPFFLAGGLKIVYDLGLYGRFRGVRLSEPEAAPR